MYIVLTIVMESMISIFESLVELGILEGSLCIGLSWVDLYR